MEPKEFPERRQYPGGPPIPPYDMTGYELRYQMGLEVVNIDVPFELPSGDWGEVDREVGRVEVEGDGDGFLVHPNSNWLYRGLTGLIEQGQAERTTRSSAEVPAGSYWLRDLETDEAGRLAAEFGLTLTRAPDNVASAGPARVRMPRVAIYRSWQAAMPEGWTRWVFDQYGLSWTNVWDADVRSGALADFDVLILPSQGEQGLREGHAPGTMPERYVGGLGDAGVAAITQFVADGGRLIAIDQAVDFAIHELDLPFRNTVAGVPSEKFFLPGSIIQLEVDTEHPLGWGMAPDAVTLFARSQVLERIDDGRGTRVSTPVCYAESDYLISGWTLGGDEYLAGRTAVAQISVGRGDVVLFGFQPHFRGQPRNTFKLLFNAVMGAATAELPEGEGLACR
jgi:hypothetical protein